MKFSLAILTVTLSTALAFPSQLEKRDNGRIRYTIQRYPRKYENTWRGPPGYPNAKDVINNFDPKVAEWQGTTDRMSIDIPRWWETSNVYSSPVPNTEYILVNHEFYICPDESTAGSYKITLKGKQDDITLVYTGDKVKNYKYDNADVWSETQKDGDNDHSWDTPTINAGDYFPVRIIYLNAQQAAVLKVEVKDPKGNVILDDKSSNGNFIKNESPLGKEFQPYSAASSY